MFITVPLTDSDDSALSCEEKDSSKSQEEVVGLELTGVELLEPVIGVIEILEIDCVEEDVTALDDWIGVEGTE